LNFREPIHPSAIISDKAIIGKDVAIGPHTIVYDHVQIGDNSVIGPNCILGEPTVEYYSQPDYENPSLIIGPHALIRSGAVLYAGATLEDHFECGHNIIVREYSRVGPNTRLGNYCDLQGYCQIGAYARMHANIRIGQKSKIGDYVWIFPFVTLTNDPYPPSNQLFGITIKDYAVIATQVVLLPGITIGQDSLVGAGSVVNRDVPAEMVYSGNPARHICSIYDLRHKYTPNRERVYPWRYTFERGMPWEGIGYENWEQEMQESQSKGVYGEK
jgi:acetyltransferase-like isoleucine patch superfamily enzyme